jgi:hypothetical protein
MAKAHTLVDNFNDNAQDTTKWIASTTERLREVNGRVEIRPAPNAAASYYYNSHEAYDLTGSEFQVELVRAPFGEYGVGASLEARTTSGDWVRFQVADGKLQCEVYIAQVWTQLADVSYDPVRHRWLRLRERLGTLYWEVSADGEEWEVVLDRSPHPINLTAVKARFGAEVTAAVGAGGVAIFDNFNVRDATRARRVEERRLSARDLRVQAAEVAAARPHDEHANNNDETNYLDQAGRQLAGMYSKSLKHDALGDPDPVSYMTLLRALESRDPHDFEEIQLASATALKLTNPQAGLAFDVEGPDPQEVTIPPAPRFDSEQAAHEAGELYWMAVARDIPFIKWAGSDIPEENLIIQRAIYSLQNEFPRFGGTTPTNDAQNLFRGVFPGEQTGPYVSQFLLKGNNDRRGSPALTPRLAKEGLIAYGTQVIDQRQLTAAPQVDYLTGFNAWLDAQNGVDTRGQDQFDPTRRFIRSLRDGATYVHFDQVVNAFFNAALILMAEPFGNQLDQISGRTFIDLDFAKDQGNPYDPPDATMDSRTQVGFGTFGPIHILQVLSEVLGRAIRAVWWQKWGVHRRLRPEEYGGRVDNWIAGRRDYPLHPSIKSSLTGGGLAPYFGQAGEKFPSYLLPQAYPEGAPTHPAYGAGHAAGAGACATILKAFFDETRLIENPVQASDDGLSLVPYTGTGATNMSVRGELNKLAGNIAIFRNAAGVHWRSDYTESLPFGESIAIGLLQEMSLGFNEDDAFFALTKFDGQRIRIFDGKVVPVVI